MKRDPRQSNRDRDEGRGPRIFSAPHPDDETRLARIERMVSELLRRSDIELGMELKQMTDFSNLVREVRETKDAADATKKALDGYIARIKELELSNPDDQKQVDQAVADLQAVQDELATAVPANTPADTGASAGGVTG